MRQADAGVADIAEDHLRHAAGGDGLVEQDVGARPAEGQALLALGDSRDVQQIVRIDHDLGSRRWRRSASDAAGWTGS